MVETEQIQDLFMELVRISSLSGSEKRMADRCAKILRSHGCQVDFDSAGEAIGGDTGNLIARLPGDSSRPTVLLTAHMDTVVPGENINPHRDNHDVVWSDGTTVLGADDKAGITAILLAVQALSADIDHCPVEIIFTIAEEQGLQGSRLVDVTKLESRAGLCLDSSGRVGTLVVEGPTQVKWSAEFTGRAAHAGVAPERGVSAIKMAASAVSRMPHGRINANTTVNVGSFVGQGPTNVVRDHVTLQGEARSLVEDELWPMIDNMQRIFGETAAEFGGGVEFAYEKMYSGFTFPETHPVRTAALSAMLAIGVSPEAVKSGGGSDANIFTANGIPTLNIGIGYEDIHSTSEHISLSDIGLAAEAAVEFCRRYGSIAALG